MGPGKSVSFIVPNKASKKRKRMSEEVRSDGLKIFKSNRTFILRAEVSLSPYVPEAKK